MTETQKERQRCEQIIINALKRNKDHPLVSAKLKLILQKIRKPNRLTGVSGGPLNEQPATPSDNSTDRNLNAT